MKRYIVPLLIAILIGLMFYRYDWQPRTARLDCVENATGQQLAYDTASGKALEGSARVEAINGLYEACMHRAGYAQ